MKTTRFVLLGAATLLGACTVMPPGPTVTALPGSGKTFDQFRADDASCRQYASQQVSGVSPGQAAAGSELGSAALGTALGAAAGAALGGGHGAAVGAGAGLIGGSVLGLGAAQGSGYSVQQRYDAAYMQCMYAAGHRVPTQGGVPPQQGYYYRYQAPPPGYAAPPPVSAPPPGY
ncbi:MAG TPA: hypothetical protein VL689_07490 [Paraburkholderia sp.]|jgi:outer membrane lipoprotein SlyB|nr:hypothetical protein [Paraburkholderia sp.]